MGTAATMVATMGAPHLNIRLLLALGSLTGLCCSLAYGSPSQSFDKISLVDNSEVGRQKQKEEVAAVDSLLETNEDLNNSLVGALRVPRNSKNEDSKVKQKRKKKVVKKAEKENKIKKKTSERKKPKKLANVKEDKIKKKTSERKKPKKLANDKEDKSKNNKNTKKIKTKDGSNKKVKSKDEKIERKQMKDVEGKKDANT